MGVTMENLVGKGRKAIEIIFDKDSFAENSIGAYTQPPDIGPGAVIGTVKLKGREATVIANDAAAINPRFNVVYAGVIGMEEAYKMALAVYKTIEADADKPKKRPLVLIVDSPGNGPGKYEEITGMNKATGAYQLALAEARQKGHPVIAMIIGRAISGAFLCHGLQADHILALSGKFSTMIHVMPLSSIARITKMDIETLQELSKTNPVFASGAEFFYKLGGVEEILENIDDMGNAINRHIEEIYRLNSEGRCMETGPWGRGELGAARGGRIMRKQIIDIMEKEFSGMVDSYL
jgi:malonate decarboxylase gamma subunit